MKYFEYELVPFPLALFNKNGMRKTNKSVLDSLFEPTKKDYFVSNERCSGFLLHIVIWPKDASVATICNSKVILLTSTTIILELLALWLMDTQTQPIALNYKKKCDVTD